MRPFAVFFDAPIDSVCGLELLNVGASPALMRTARAFAVDCKLDRTGELKVNAAN